MRVYKTSCGVTLHVDRFSPLLAEEIRQRFPPPTPPTYEIVTAGGAVEVYEHDVTTLDVAGDARETQRNWARWRKHQADIERRMVAISSALADAVLGIAITSWSYEGMAPEALARYAHESDIWPLVHAGVGMHVPDEPLKRRVYWLKHVVLADANELNTVMSMAATGGPQPTSVDAAMSTFPNQTPGATPGGPAS